MFERQLGAVTDEIDETELTAAVASLRKLERFWLQQLGFGPRVADFPFAA